MRFFRRVRSKKEQNDFEDAVSRRILGGHEATLAPTAPPADETQLAMDGAAETSFAPTTTDDRGFSELSAGATESDDHIATLALQTMREEASTDYVPLALATEETY